MKIRVMYSTSKKRMATYADALARSQNINVDRIPPAFPCDRERLVVLVLTLGQKVDDKVRRFAKELTKDRTSNVAFVFDSKTKELTEAMKEVIGYVKEAGANVIENYYFVDGGGPLTLTGKITIDQRKDIVNWLEELMETIKQ